jgi:hypothetical protein
MMAAISEMAAGVSESSFGRWWRKAGDFLDCAIPIALVIVIVYGTAAIAFGFVE